MDNNNTLITDFDFKIIANYFRGLNRQGPGSDEQTLKALSCIPGLDQMKRIADIGCGTGAQTNTLALHTGAKIIASDLLPEMLEGLNERMIRNGFSDRVEPLMASMDQLPFADESFDLIWAEGSIYNIGFEKGFTEWKRMIRKGGYIGVSEACWLSTARPENTDYLLENHPEIDLISSKLHIIEKAGYIPVAHFILPEYCWTNNYYDPMEEYMEIFLKQNNNETAVHFINRMKEEILYYQNYKEYFGYVFFVAQKM